MNIIITMAGEGSRFKKAGYSQPKYQIEAQGQSLFAWAMRSLDNFRLEDSQFIFIARKDDDARGFIATECTRLGIHKHIVLEIEALTDGQATTAALANEVITDLSCPIAVYNIDTYVDPTFLLTEKIRGDGWIPCFSGLGDHWSFARLGDDDRVAEVREKQRVSPHATIGLYWFSSFDLYLDTYQRYYRDSTKLEKGEKYIAPLYNQMIHDGLEVFIDEVPIEVVHGLGTPEEVKMFSSITI